jgi:hypothetical protein
MVMNDVVAPAQVSPGIRIHDIDIDHPPGIGIPPIADIDSHHWTVSATAPVKSTATILRKTRWDALPDPDRAPTILV